MQHIKILGSGKYLPPQMVTSAEVDRRIGVSDGWSEKKSGVQVRYFAEHETASYMAKMAIEDAMADAGLTFEDIDCIIGTSGSMEQPIPCNAALIQKELGLGESGIPCFDVNSTCLSFVVGLDVASHMIEAGKYNNIILVSSEVASSALNWGQNESSVLFGDGAAAVIIGKSKPEEASRIIASRMETYSKGAHLSEVRGGGTKYHPREHSEETKGEFLFDMDGQAIFRMTNKLIEDFIDRLFKGCDLQMNEIKMVIPHQASKTAMTLVRKRLGIDEARFMSIIEDHGNTIAASIPMALHEAIKQNRIKRGDVVMLLGTSAGLSIGGMILEY